MSNKCCRPGCSDASPARKAHTVISSDGNDPFDLDQRSIKYILACTQLRTSYAKVLRNLTPDESKAEVRQLLVDLLGIGIGGSFKAALKDALTVYTDRIRCK